MARLSDRERHLLTAALSMPTEDLSAPARRAIPLAHARLNGATFAECGQVIGVTVERARQMIHRLMRQAQWIDDNDPMSFLSVRAYNGLRNLPAFRYRPGPFTWEDFANIHLSELRRTKNVGKQSIEEIRQLADRKGIRFTDPAWYLTEN